MLITIEQIANTEYCLDMRGDEKWVSKVKRLIQILEAAAPKDKPPAYTFASYYYCKDGHWYENSWGKYTPVSVFDVAIDTAAITLCLHCGQPWPETETILPSGELGCSCRRKNGTPPL